MSVPNEFDSLTLAELRQRVLDKIASDFDAYGSREDELDTRFIWVRSLQMMYHSIFRRAALGADIAAAIESGKASTEDFVHWARMPSWSGDETSALFAGLDPRKVIRVLKDIGMAAEVSDVANVFSEIQSILKRAHASSFYTPERYLNPVVAIAWATQFEIAVPPALKSAVERMWAEQVEEELEPPLGTRERNNLLRILAGLAKEAGIETKEGGGGALQIEAAVQAAGFDGPKERTIRDILKSIREL